MEHTITSNPEHKKRRRKRIKIILLSIVALLVIFRLILPYIILNYVNKVLANIDQYYGHVEDIDLVLIRGAYVINDIKIEKKDSVSGKLDSIPFFTAPKIDLSVEWKAIFKGEIVGEIYVEDPVLNFVNGKHKGEDVKADTADFRQVIDDLMPLTVNHFEISNGQIHYIDKFSNPHIDVSLKDVEVVATNLSNVNDSSKLLPARLEATGNAYEGKFNLNVDFDALNKVPTFDMNATITHVNMVLLNDFFKAYGNFDLKKGNFGLYTEFAAKDSKFNGYVKPIIKDVDIVQWNEEEGNAAQILWETLIAGAAEIFKNHNKEQLASKIPIEGRFDDPTVNLWDALSYVLRNAFVQALKPSIDNTINIGKVEDTEKDKTFLQKVFGKKENDGDKKTEREKRREERKEKREKRKENS